MSPSSDDQSRNDKKRFVAHPRRESSRQVIDERAIATLADMRGLYGEAQEIVDEGQSSFMAEENLRTRRAATALIIHLSDAAHRKEIVAIQDRFPDVNWSALRGQRNVLGHQYRDIDFTIVWETLSKQFPRERKILGLN